MQAFYQLNYDPSLREVEIFYFNYQVYEKIQNLYLLLKGDVIGREGLYSLMKLLKKICPINKCMFKGNGEDGKKCCKMRKFLLIFVISFFANWIFSKTPMFSNAAKNYIMKNPKHILESVENMFNKEKQNKVAAAKNVMHERLPDIINDQNAIVLGNPKGEFSVVEFFDYNCGYCKKAQDSINYLIDHNKNVRVIMVNLPIFGEPSIQAAKASIAVWKFARDKFEKFHTALLKKPKMDLHIIKSTLSDVGIGRIDADAILKEIDKSESIESAIETTYNLSRDIGLTGTPAFIVSMSDGKKAELIPSYVSGKDLLSAVDKIKKAE